MQNEEKEIIKEQATDILGDDAEEIFRKCEITVYCSNCTSRNDRIVDMITDKYFLDRSGDIILRGTCDQCDSPVTRVIESGENQEMYKRAGKYFDAK